MEVKIFSLVCTRMSFIPFCILQGVMQPRYIVEITIHPFVYKAIADPVVLQLHPVYEDEEGRCYLRRTASTAAVSRSSNEGAVSRLS